MKQWTTKAVSSPTQKVQLVGKPYQVWNLELPNSELFTAHSEMPLDFSLLKTNYPLIARKQRLFRAIQVPNDDLWDYIKHSFQKPKETFICMQEAASYDSPKDLLCSYFPYPEGKGYMWNSDDGKQETLERNPIPKPEVVQSSWIGPPNCKHRKAENISLPLFISA